jgi:tetratricopeptide (TPR) repeat protein
VRETVELARTIRQLARGYLHSESRALLNETFLEALLALETGAPDAAEAVARADSAFHQGVAVRHRAAYLVLLADMFERIGDHRSALNRYRREWFQLGEEQAQFRTTRLLGRARNAAALGYRDEALEAYERYLAFRSDPEPVLAEQASEIRRDYSRLAGDGS